MSQIGNMGFEKWLKSVILRVEFVVLVIQVWQLNIWVWTQAGLKWKILDPIISRQKLKLLDERVCNEIDLSEKSKNFKEQVNKENSKKRWEIVARQTRGKPEGMGSW